MTAKPALVVALALVVAALPAAAGEPAAEKEVHPAVKGFKDSIYDLEALGLKDLAVELDTPIFRGSGLFKHIKVMVYTKTPDRHLLDIVGLPKETREVYLELLKPIATLTRYLFGLGSILVKVLQDAELNVVQDEEGLFKITAVPQSPALIEDFKRVTLWVDETFRPVRIHQESPSLGDISVRLTTVRKDEKFLVETLAVKGVKGIEGEILMKIRYQEIKPYQLPDSVTLKIVKPGDDKGLEEGAQDFHFKDYIINKGLDASVFPDEKDETPEKKGPEGED